MIDQERVREMTKLAAYETHEGKRYGQVTRYFRGDFAGRHLLKGFFCGTIAFGICLLMWGVCRYQTWIDHLDQIDLVGLGISVLVWNLTFLVVYLIAVDIYANVFYAVGRKRTKRYYQGLKRLGRYYEEQGRTMSARHEEE